MWICSNSRDSGKPQKALTMQSTPITIRNRRRKRFVATELPSLLDVFAHRQPRKTARIGGLLACLGGPVMVWCQHKPNAHYDGKNDLLNTRFAGAGGAGRARCCIRTQSNHDADHAVFTCCKPLGAIVRCRLSMAAETASQSRGCHVQVTPSPFWDPFDLSVVGLTPSVRHHPPRCDHQ